MLPEPVHAGETARELDPEGKINSSALNRYLFLREYDRLLESLPVNDSLYIVFYRGRAEYYRRNWKQASALFDGGYELDPTGLQAQSVRR